MAVVAPNAMALVVASAVAPSFFVMTGTTVLTRSPAPSRAFSSFAPAAVHLVAVGVIVVAVVAPSTAVGTAAMVGPTVVTKRAMVTQGIVLSTAAAAVKATVRRAHVRYSYPLSVALAAVVVGWSVVGVHSGARRGEVGLTRPAVVPRSVRYVVEGRHHAVLVLVAVAAGSVERSARRSVRSMDRA